ncbi:MAG TPA: VWA domain-containing protein [Thermoanaerobaculia bacterium]|nr:VWA domain-containing protein [Thermoanaerobaculia bacterium]
MKRMAFMFLIASAAVAQTSERVNVTLVEVPVTVADGSGNPVRGLKAENFIVSDDRGKHPVATFDVVDFAAPGKIDVPPPARRSFLLLFDLSNTTANAMARARKAAQDFVGSAVHPSDLAAVGTISVESGFRLVTAFTSDRALLAAAIESPLSFIVSDPLGVANGPSWKKVEGILGPVYDDPRRCFS